MILLDISGTIYGAIHVDLGRGEVDVNPKYLRHLILNSLRHYNQLFREEYGEMVICTDGSSWRKSKFPLYKYERSMSRQDDDNDWDSIFKTVTQILEDIEMHFPFKVVSQINSEADDIIGVLARDSQEKTLVISNDKDLGALTKLANVSQWRPQIANRNNDHKAGFVQLSCDEARRFEFDLIVSGDKSDGIPNIKCGDTFFKDQYEARIRGEKVQRAPAITQKFKQELWDIFNVNPATLRAHLGEEMGKNFLRNWNLICLTNTPEDIVEDIRYQYSKATSGNEMKALTYMIDNNMNLLAKHVADFRPNKLKPSNTIFGEQ